LGNFFPGFLGKTAVHLLIGTGRRATPYPLMLQ
jgi:hypothetical protein